LGDIGEIRYICARRLNLGLFQKDINVAWDLAPHDLSIILALMGEQPISVNCHGSAHVTPGIEDVTAMCLTFSNQRSAIIHSSWLDPRKVREMTIVGSKRMIVYDDLAPLEKIRVFDTRVDRPPHYDTFAEFQYAYHYGDMHAPYIKQEEPLKTECQHFLDCIKQGAKPLSCGTRGLELVKILEASSESLRHDGAVVQLSKTSSWLASLAAPTSNPRGQKAAKTLANGSGHQRRASNTGGHPHHKLAMNGNGH
jgi:predicted dehydrogenase